MILVRRAEDSPFIVIWDVVSRLGTPIHQSVLGWRCARSVLEAAVEACLGVEAAIKADREDGSGIFRVLEPFFDALYPVVVNEVAKAASSTGVNGSRHFP